MRRAGEKNTREREKKHEGLKKIQGSGEKNRRVGENNIREREKNRRAGEKKAHFKYVEVQRFI